MLSGDEIEAAEARLRELDVLLTHAFRVPSHTLRFDADATRYGECTHDGIVSLCLVNKRHTALLKWETNLDTLCHELAHLVHWEHRPAHRRLTSAMKEWAKRNGFG